MSDSTILEGPDGNFYRVPNDSLATFKLSGKELHELRTGSKEGAAVEEESSGTPAGHKPPPEGFTPPPLKVQPQEGGVTLNFYFDGGAPRITRGAPEGAIAADVEGHHFVPDESGIATLHDDWLDGVYVDRSSGTTMIGVHSHNPIYGNAM